MRAQPVSAVCDRSFHATRTSGSRDLNDVHWIVLHDEEAPTALSAARWFADPRPADEGGPAGSAHLCTDDAVCYRTLTNVEVPWAAASCFGANHGGFHIEQAGYAAWSSVLWRSHLVALQRAAYKTALHCRGFYLPPRFVTAADLPALNGVTTHAEITKASRRLDPEHAWKYTHSDPGPFWPRRLFMRYVKRFYAELRGPLA